MATVDSDTSQLALDKILEAIGTREADYEGKVTILGKDPILASRHRFGELMAASQAAFGMGLGRLWQLRGGSSQDVTTSVQGGVHQHHGIALGHFMVTFQVLMAHTFVINMSHNSQGTGFLTDILDAGATFGKIPVHLQFISHDISDAAAAVCFFIFS